MASFTVIKEFHKKIKIKCLCDKEYIIKKKTKQINPCNCNSNSLIIEKCENTSFNIYKNRALSSNLKFTLNPSQFNHLIKQNCYYCYSEPREYSEGTIRNGIDRINNNEGYIIENVITCCSICNKMKGTLTKEQFIDHLKKINKEQINRNSVSETMLFYKDFKTGKFQPPHVVQVLLNAEIIKPEEVYYPIYESLVDFPFHYKCAKDWLKACLKNTLQNKKTINKVFEVLKMEAFLKWYSNFHITGKNDLTIIAKSLPNIDYGDMNKSDILIRTNVIDYMEQKFEYIDRWGRSNNG